MKQYLKILQKEISTITEEDLYSPVKQTNIDSIDLVVIRVALEKHFGFEIPDNIWFNSQSLDESIAYFDKNKDSKRIADFYTKSDVTLSDDIEIRMPQMANSSLSEFWLIQYFGDAHWQLLTKGFNKKSSEFQSHNNNRLYATFLRIRYEISPLNQFVENDVITFQSNIKGFGNNSFLSKIIGDCKKKNLQATLMTTFSERENLNNTKITKCEPRLDSSNILPLSKKPLFLNDYRLLRKNLIERIESPYGHFIVNDKLIFTIYYEINPFYDINGVGLLYFASYPLISDSCLLKYLPRTMKSNTIYRDIFYCANSNMNDKIIFKLNSFIEDKNYINLQTSLYRESDNQLLSKIFTVKQKLE